MTALRDRVRAVLCQAADLYAGSEPGAVLRAHVARMDGPLGVAIAGKAKAGKSTLLNALVGDEIAPTDAAECTRVVTWYRFGQQPRVVLYPKDAAPVPMPVDRRTGALRLDLRGLRPVAVHRIVVDWPAASLRDTVLVDTPGVASASGDLHEHATRLLAPEDGPGAADAVVYLMRHLHSTDLRLLDAFQDNGIGRDNPLNTVAVFSRADEIGVGRIDALLSARRIADRYRADPRLRTLCGTVVPVAGLLAQAGRTMRQDEYAALVALASVRRADVEARLAGAGRSGHASHHRGERVRRDVGQQPASLAGRYAQPVPVSFCPAVGGTGANNSGHIAPQLLREASPHGRSWCARGTLRRSISMVCCVADE